MKTDCAAGALTAAQLESFRQGFSAQPGAQAAMERVCREGILAAARRSPASDNEDFHFSLRLYEGAVTDQGQSGRCWIHASLSCLRGELADLDGLELSPGFVAFYDLLEKANAFLERIMQTTDMPTDSRLLTFWLDSPIQDAGQWDTFCRIASKYGLVPKYAMPQTAVAAETGALVGGLSDKLRNCAFTLREAAKAGKTLSQLRGLKQDMLAVVYRMLCISLGCPPQRFIFEAVRRDGTSLRESSLTPLEFYERYAAGFVAQPHVSLIHAPIDGRPYGRCYAVAWSGGTGEPYGLKHLNLPMRQIKQAVLAQLKDGKPVWFGCDARRFADKQAGIFDLSLYDFDGLFQSDFDMEKGAALTYRNAAPTHAMVLQGMEPDEAGLPLRWCVENSFGPDIGQDGYCTMTDAWFDRHVYQVVVQRRYIPDKLAEAYDAAPTLLDPWDPIGTLAR